MRVRLDLAYDGTDFSGWGIQPGLRTVQGVLEAALTQISRHPVRVVVAGRTDSGVHASGQVVSLDLNELPHPRRLAGVLPKDLVVTAITEVPDSFDARFSAIGRSYRYRITDGIPDPLRRRDTVTWRYPVDVPLMRSLAPSFLGEHDFAAYCKRREGATTVRELQRLEIAREGSVVTFELAADAFCHSMVRALCGGLLAAGEGSQSPEVPVKVLQAGVRDGRLRVAPPHGLTLTGVRYPEGADALLARQRESRRLRVATRLATASDIPGILGVFDEAVRWLVGQGREGQWGTSPQSLDPGRIAAVTEAVAAGRMRVAVSGPVLLGAVEVGGRKPYAPPVNEPERYVRLLLTSKSRAPFGLGRELLQRVVEEAAADGVRLVRLDCFRSADRALIKVYERAGFTATSEFEVDGWPGQLLELRV